MAATGKLYRAIAKDVRRQLTDARKLTPARRQATEEAIIRMVGELSVSLKVDNRHFVYSTFYISCGLDDTGRQIAL